MSSAKIRLEQAFDTLWGPIMEWIHYPSQGKRQVLAAYASLSEDQKALLSEDVSRVFRAIHESDSVVAYRYKKVRPDMGGASLTTRKPDYLPREKYVAFLVRDSDVLAHWGQRGLPLGGTAFGHEQELILKPDAKPVRLD